jgi:anthranilate synthase component 2
MIILIDNYDSFTYNLYQLLSKYDTVVVYRNDEITIDQIKQLNPSHIVISPGPKAPKDAGISLKVIKKLYRIFPILGICLGHQCIVEAFGGNVSSAQYLMHGKLSEICILEHNYLFKNINQNKIKAVRYHSLIAEPSTMPEELIVTSQTALNEIMSIRHRDYPVFGVQFHPESYLTVNGEVLIQNFLRSGQNVSTKFRKSS